jgi:hypothetical protein
MDEKYVQIIGLKPEGRRPLGGPRRGWKNIKIDLKEAGL